MKKIELTDKLLNKEYLKKSSLNITEIREVFGIARDRAQGIVREIRQRHKIFYKERTIIFGSTSIAPMHMMMYLGYSREEFLKLISE